MERVEKQLKGSPAASRQSGVRPIDRACVRLSFHMANSSRAITPWFCVKSTLLGDARPDPAPGSQKKVFLNVCTQPSVPKAPESPDGVFHDHLESSSESDRYLIPIVLTEPKEDVDKGASKPI